MSYIDILRKLNNHSSTWEAGISNGKQMENILFTQDESYRKAKLSFDGVETDIDVRIINDKSSANAKEFILRPDTNVDIGSMIIIDEGTYLCKENMEYNNTCPTIKSELCNQIIKVSEEISIPCIVDASSYGVKLSSSDDYLKFSDTKIQAIAQRNDLTNTIPLNFRFMLENSKQGVYKISDFSVYNKNLLTLVCEKTQFLEGYDNTTTGICFNEEIPTVPEEDPIETTPTTYTISGEEEIKKLINQTYTVSPMSPIGSFSLVDNSITVISQDNTSITLQGTTVGIYDTINYTVDNEIVATFDVMVIR